MGGIRASDHRRPCAASCDEVARLNLIIQTQADIAAAGGDRDRLMAVVVERAKDLAGADGAVVEVCEGAHLVCRFGSGMASGVIGLRVPLEGSLSGLCHRTGEILTCADAAGDERVDRLLCERTGIRAMVVVPLTADGEIVGVLTVMSRRPRSFAEPDAATLRIVADFIGVALSRAKALTAQNEALQVQQDELKALNAELMRQQAATEAQVRARTRELAEQRNFLANLLERLPGGVALLDLNLDFQLANPAYARAFGKRVEDMMGRHVFEVFPGSEAQVEHLLYGVIRTGEPFTAFGFPFAYHDADGHHETFWDFTYFPLRNAWGEVDSVLSLCLEVTPRVVLERQVEDHARQIERDKDFLETVLDHLPAGVFIVGPDHCYQWVNEAAAAMAGQPRAAMVGRDLYAYAPTAPRPNPRLAQVFATGEYFQAAEVPLQRADGHLGYYDLSYVPLRDDGGEVHSVMIAGVEVTARVENQRLQSAQLEALRQASVIKDEFIAVASHELRTPLTVIRNAAAILAKGRAGELSEAQAAFTTMILRTVAHLSRLVDDLLDLQKLETGELHCRRGQGDLAAMVHEVASGFAPVAEAKGLTFTVTAPDGPLAQRFDADRLAQVLHNLLSNAARFTPAGGTIALAVARDGAAWRLSVSDTGIGIAEADHARIFEKFVQVENSLQRESGGSGLGLAIARRIVEDGHGGTLEVSSRLGAGSCFTVVLPRG